MVAQGLDIAADEVRAVAARGGQDAQGVGVGPHHQQAAGGMDQVGDLLPLGLQAAQVAGILEVHGGDPVAEPGLQVGQVHEAGLRVEGDRLDPQHRLAVVADGLQAVGADVGGHQGLRAVRVAPGHAQRGAGGLEPVVGRHVADVHVQQLGHQALVFPERLEPPEVLVGLPGVRREELAAPVDLVADHGDVVVVAAGAQEARGLLAGGVPAQEALHVPPELVLGRDRPGNVHLPAEAQGLGNIGVQIIDAAGADLREHPGLHLGDGVGDVGVGVSFSHGFS